MISLSPSRTLRALLACALVAFGAWPCPAGVSRHRHPRRIATELARKAGR
jgi:hypothetical protein